MISLLVCVAMSQAKLPQGQQAFGNPADVEPFVGGFLQQVCGLKTMKDEVLGQYKVNQPNTKERSEVRVGHMGHKVLNDVWENKPVLKFESDALRTFRKGLGGGDILTVFQGVRIAHIDPKGKLLHDKRKIRTVNGVFDIEATFKDDQIDVVWTTPKGERKHSVTPAEGTAAFDREFEPMLDGEKVLMKEKTFLRLDAETGGFEKVTVRIPGRFEGQALNKKHVGHRVEYVTATRTLIAYVTYEGKLLQVDLPRNQFLFAEVVPGDKESDIQRLKNVKTIGG